MNIISEIETEFLVSIPIEHVTAIKHIRDLLGYIWQSP